MAMQCNIDENGSRIRFRLGVACVMVGLLIGLLQAYRGGGVEGWIASGALLACGAFMIFEARKRWCVMRAMGFKTKV